MKTVNKNFIYNTVYQIFIYIIPLVLTPYISRILGPDKIGVYSYTYSIVYYFMLITLLGINNYGSRTIAKAGENKEIRSKLFLSIYVLQLSIGAVMLIVYNIIIFTMFKEYFIISLIHNFFLMSAIFDINWFYFGIEKFKITISRNVIIKIVSLIMVFCFVKNEKDLWVYTLIMSVSTLISQLYLFLFLNKYINKSNVRFKDSIKHLKSCLILFIPVLSYGIYRVMDKTLLGYLSSTIELGFYENAEKIINIPISLLTAMGTVMIPHMAKSSNDKDKINEKLIDSFELCFCFMIPIIFGLFGIARDFSIIYFGEEFIKSGTIIMILTPTILFTAIANVIRTNYLIPFEKDRIYVESTIYGAIVNLILNIIFIKEYGAIGACIGTIVAEFIVMFYQVIKVRKEIDLKNIGKILCLYIIKGTIILMYIYIISFIIKNIYTRLLIQIIGSITVYIILNKKYILYNFFGKREK